MLKSYLGKALCVSSAFALLAATATVYADDNQWLDADDVSHHVLNQAPPAAEPSASPASKDDSPVEAAPASNAWFASLSGGMAMDGWHRWEGIQPSGFSSAIGSVKREWLWNLGASLGYDYNNQYAAVIDYWHPFGNSIKMGGRKVSINNHVVDVLARGAIVMGQAHLYAAAGLGILMTSFQDKQIKSRTQFVPAFAVGDYYDMSPRWRVGFDYKLLLPTRPILSKKSLPPMQSISFVLSMRFVSSKDEEV